MLLLLPTLERIPLYMRNPIMKMLSVDPEERFSPYFLLNCAIGSSTDNQLYHTPATYMFPTFYNELYPILYKFNETEILQEKLSILSV